MGDSGETELRGYVQVPTELSDAEKRIRLITGGHPSLQELNQLALEIREKWIAEGVPVCPECGCLRPGWPSIEPLPESGKLKPQSVSVHNSEATQEAGS